MHYHTDMITHGKTITAFVTTMYTDRQVGNMLVLLPETIGPCLAQLRTVCLAEKDAMHGLPSCPDIETRVQKSLRHVQFLKTNILMI